MSDEDLFAPEVEVLQTRYGLPETDLQTLAMLAAVETPKVAALSMLGRRTCRTRTERQDCLLLLDVCTRGLGGR